MTMRRQILTAGEWQLLSLREAGVRLIDCDHRTPPAANDGYPPDKQEKATQTVLAQAELLCRDWAG
jgi:hypothetical protein